MRGRLCCVGLALAMVIGCTQVNPDAGKSPEGPPADRKPGPDGGASPPRIPIVKQPAPHPELESLLPDLDHKMPFKDEQPISFLTSDKPEWEKLKNFWNPDTEDIRDPRGGERVIRKIVKIKVPLGLPAPPVPPENPMTVQKWELGKQLFNDKILSTPETTGGNEGVVSCATCHDSQHGFADQSTTKTSKGVRERMGQYNAPSLINSAYHPRLSWDGRASSLEEQIQNHVANRLEMFDGKPDEDAWHQAIERVRHDRVKSKYGDPFVKVFGHAPTRDTVAKAIAVYVRTLLSGNSVYDQAEAARQKRIKDGKLPADTPPTARDYGSVKFADRVANGQLLFFGKARCSTCHSGPNFTDNRFHNLGVGVGKDGELPKPVEEFGRYAALPLGHKDANAIGQFKTPSMRVLSNLINTAPYMHDGSADTLEAVVDFYDRGGNLNRYLDAGLRDLETEQSYVSMGKKAFTEAREARKLERERRRLFVALSALPEVSITMLPAIASLKQEPPEPEVAEFDGQPIVVRRLGLTADEKADLLMFLRALEGELVDPDPKATAERMPMSNPGN